LDRFFLEEVQGQVLILHISRINGHDY
jgi:hypothetical protein